MARSINAYDVQARARAFRAPPPQTLEIPMPWKGIDLSQPRTNPDPRTCLASVNVRSFNPMGDRHGLGKRGGSRKASDTQFTSSAAGVYGPTVYTRVNGLDTRSIPRRLSFGAGPSEFIRPNGTPTNNGWAINGFAPAPTVHESLDEVTPDDNTTDIFATNPTGGFIPPLVRVNMSNPSFGAAPVPANTGVIARFRFLQDDPFPQGVGSGVEGAVPPASDEFIESRAGSGGVLDSQSTGIKMRIWQGATLILETPFLLPPTFAEWHTMHVVLTPGQIATITNGNNLDMEFSLNPDPLGGGAVELFRVTWAEIEFVPQSVDPSDFEPEALVLLRGTAYTLNLRSGTASARGLVPNAGNLSASMPSIAYFKERWYVVDGDDQDPARAANLGRGVIIDPATNPPTITAWDPVATIRGCRFVQIFRRRAVVARQEGANPNPSAGYMSAVDPPGNPAAAGGLNTAAAWAFGADTDRPAESSAVAWTNKPLGGVEDIITGLIAWHEDYLLVGGASSINVMAGDPGYRGTFVNITRRTGLLGQRAWCFGHATMSNGDEREVLYFLGSGGLYMLDPPNKPVNLSGRRLYRHLERIDPSKVKIELTYDAFKKEVHIYITPHEPPMQTQGYPADDFTRDIVYDVVADAFHFDSHRWSTMGAWSSCSINGQSDDDRRILIGGNDGYVRRWFEGGVLGGAQRYGTADDMAFNGTGGEAITSRVRLHPFRLPKPRTQYTALEFSVIGTDRNPPLSLPYGDVNWYWICGNSAVEAAETPHQAARRSGTWQFSPSAFGALPGVGLRETAGGHQVQIEQISAVASWGIDQLIARFEEAAPLRVP